MKIITPLPNDCYLACSGGVDSMVAYNFLTKSKRKVCPLFFNHGTETSNIAEQFLINQCLNPTVGRITTEKTKQESPEEYFRNQRYIFFSAFSDKPIITCHHLDDQLETWILYSLQGKNYHIPYRRGNFIHPFLNVTKQEIYQYANRHKLKWVEDKSNTDVNIPRNRIRHLIVPEMKRLNPSIYKYHLTKESK